MSSAVVSTATGIVLNMIAAVAGIDPAPLGTQLVAIAQAGVNESQTWDSTNGFKGWHQDQSLRGNETYNYAGRVAVPAQLVAGEKTAVLITIGQSTINNSVQGAYVPTNGAKVQNFSIDNGSVYVAQDPLLGSELLLSNFATRLADKLINAVTYQRVIIVPIAIGGSYCNDWSPGGGPSSGGNVTGTLNYRIGWTAKRLAAVGYTATAILWQQGEWDSDAPGTAQTDYASCLNRVIGSFRTAGINAPFLVGLCTRPGAANTAQIRAAQQSVVNNPAGKYLGADTDSIGAGGRYDGTHFNATGADQQATLWQAAINSYLASQ
jgi:hypothetical protein